MPKPVPVKDRFTKDQTDEVIRLFNSGKSQMEIAKRFDVPRRTMGKLFKYLGLKRTPKQAAALKNKSKLDRPEIVDKIRQMRSLFTISQIAEAVGGTHSAVSRICAKYDIALDKELFAEIQRAKMKSIWTDEKRKEISGSTYPELNDVNWLKEKYIDQALSMGDIQRLLGCHIGTVSHHLRRHDIPLKPKDVYLRNQRRKNSSNKKVQTKWGVFHLQSKAEQDYIDFLSNHDVKSVKNDPVTLEHKGSEYVPDFEVDGQYVEIKPPEYSKYPGVDRQRFVKQWLVAKANGVDLKCWYRNKYFECEEINDEDKYLCLNWKLVFNDTDDCFEFLKTCGFKPLKWQKDKLLLGLNNIFKPGTNLNANHPNKSTVDLIKHFNPHFWGSTHNGYCTVEEAFKKGNLSILRMAIEKLWDRKRNVNIYGLVDVIKRHYKDFAVVSIFKPWVARYVYEKYLPNGGTIIDPCMGWGGRLLATLDSTYRYIGYDLNPNSIRSHKNLRKFIGSRMSIEPEFYLADSSKIDFKNGDMVFTSPPYDDCELYKGIDSTNTITKPILENIFMKFNGIIALNLPKRQEKMCVDVASAHDFKLVEKLEMKTASFMGREKTFEPILIFRKARVT